MTSDTNEKRTERPQERKAGKPVFILHEVRGIQSGYYTFASQADKDYPSGNRRFD